MWVIALLFSGPSLLLLALQRVGGSSPCLALVREHGIWVVVFSNIGFTVGGLSGDPNHPVLASALGVAVGVAIGLVLVFVTGLWRTSQAKAKRAISHGRKSPPSKPEELPQAAVRALEQYHAEQALKESAAEIRKALDQIGQRRKTSHQIMWRFGIDPRKTNN
jgi:hypothetical protein